MSHRSQGYHQCNGSSSQVCVLVLGEGGMCVCMYVCYVQCAVGGCQFE